MPKNMMYYMYGTEIHQTKCKVHICKQALALHCYATVCGAEVSCVVTSEKILPPPLPHIPPSSTLPSTTVPTCLLNRTFLHVSKPLLFSLCKIFNLKYASLVI